MKAKEELLTMLPMKENTRSENIIQTFKNFVNKTQLPMSTWRQSPLVGDGGLALLTSLTITA